MGPVGSKLLLLRTWMSYDYIVIQVVCCVELPEQRRLCLNFFFLNMDPDKRDTTIWYRVIRNPQEFRGLTGIQQDPRIWGVIILFIPAHLHHSNENLELASKSLITIHSFLSFFFFMLISSQYF